MACWRRGARGAGSQAQISCLFATLPGVAKAQDVPGLPRLGHMEGQPWGVGMAGRESPKEPRGGGHAGGSPIPGPPGFLI